jgi:hypothetical protein
VLAAGALAASGAGADIIKKEDMRRGITTTHARCAATAQTVWVTADGRDFCVRYYVSTAGGEGVRPVVFLSGDYFGSVNLRTWQWIATSQDRSASVAFDPIDQDIDTDDLVTTADGFSRMAKTTAIHLARIGVAGTSGHHVFRKTLLELHLMNAALDAIKQGHGFEGFHLVGQSGGSIVVTGLAGLRRDIACAVTGSGRLATRHDTDAKDPARSAAFHSRDRAEPGLALHGGHRSGGPQRSGPPADRVRGGDAPCRPRHSAVFRGGDRRIPSRRRGIRPTGDGRVRARPIRYRNRDGGRHHGQAGRRL